LVKAFVGVVKHGFGVPILCGSAFKKQRCSADAMQLWIICPHRSIFRRSMPLGPDGEEASRPCDDNASVQRPGFKVMADPYGKTHLS